MGTEKCNQDVYDHGISLGFVDLSKEEAEEYCKAQTEETGCLHDWHYVGGRVHVKYLPKKEADTPAPVESFAKENQLLATARDQLQGRKFVERYLLTPEQTDQDTIVRWSQLIYSVRKSHARLDYQTQNGEPAEEAYQDLLQDTVMLTHFLHSLRITRIVED